jgi:hypothetical protein
VDHVAGRRVERPEVQVFARGVQHATGRVEAEAQNRGRGVDHAENLPAGVADEHDVPGVGAPRDERPLRMDGDRRRRTGQVRPGPE